MNALSKTGDAPTSEKLQDRLLQCKKLLIESQIEASTAYKRAERWEARYTNLGRSSAYVALGAWVAGVVIGLIFGVAVAR